jgi:hypothetical protein
MDQHSLDNIFKAGLEDHKTTLDKDALWAAIQDEAPSKKGLLLLRLLSVVGLVAAIGLSFFLYGMRYKAADTAPHIDAYTSAVEIQTTAAEQNTTPAVAEANKSQVHNQNQASKIPTLTPSTTTETSTPQYRTETATIKNQATAISKAVLSTQHSADFPKTSNLLPTADHYEVRSTIPASSINLTGINNSSSPLSPVKTLPSITAVSQINDPQSADLDYARPLPLLNKNKKVDCYEYGKKKARISGEVYSSIDFVANHFSAPVEQLDYLERRDETQTQLEGYRSGLRIKYTLPNGLYIKAGLEAGLIRERFNDEINETTIETRPNQLLDIIMQGDSTIYIYGDADVQVTRQQLWRVENTYRMLGIPVLLGYERQVGKFKYGIDMGAIHNVLYDFEGYLSNNAGAPIDDPDFFRPSINLSLTGGLTMSYSIGAKTNLFAQATMKHNLEEINNDLNEIQQKNTRIGLGIGLEYTLR